MTDVIPQRALTLTQPWAFFMLSLPDQHVKRIENRTWGSSFRGPVWVHASQKMTKRDYEEACEYAISSARVPESLIPKREDLQLGGIVGRFDIVDIILPGGKQLIRPGRPPVLDVHPMSSSRWYMGAFGYVTQEARVVPFTPCKGALGFWRVPDDVLGKLTEVCT